MFKPIHRNIVLQIVENWMFKDEKRGIFAIVNMLCQISALKSQPFEVLFHQIR